MNWDNVRVFCAVMAGGSMRGGAGVAGLSHATVSRRLGALERDLGVTLLLHRGNHYEPTPEAERLYGLWYSLQDQLTTAHRHLSGKDADLAGKIRITMPAVFVPIVSPMLTNFSRLHSRIDVHVITGNTTLNLHETEADLALRVTNSPTSDLCGEYLANFAYTVFGTTEQLHKAGKPIHASGVTDRWQDKLAWISWNSSAAPDLPWVRWMHQNVPPRNVVMRVDSPEAMHQCVRAGAGVGLLPCLLGDRDPTLHRATNLPVWRGSGIWLLTHLDLRTSARVQTLSMFLAQALSRQKQLFEGRS